MNANTLIIFAASVVIISYFYTLLARKTHVPAVLMLIGTGLVLQLALPWIGIKDWDEIPTLQVLGILGLMMIVLEAALELSFTRDKWKGILRAFGAAVIGFFATLFALGWCLGLFFELDFYQALLYATPLSIISSSVVIPSARELAPGRADFLGYESTFSDLLGIVTFFFIQKVLDVGSLSGAVGAASIELALTVLVAGTVGYGLLFLFQSGEQQVRLFALIAILILLYSVERLLHLYPLMLILFFGILLRNSSFFFRPFAREFSKKKAVKKLETEFKMMTVETSFVVQTFFFVFFGLSLAVGSLFSGTTLLVSLLVVASIYLVRFFVVLIFVGRRMEIELFLAPRGLATILLFYMIPMRYMADGFNLGVILFVFLVTTGIVTYALIRNVAEKKESDTLAAEEIADTSTPAFQTSSGTTAESASEPVSSEEHPTSVDPNTPAEPASVVSDVSPDNTPDTPKEAPDPPPIVGDKPPDVPSGSSEPDPDKLAGDTV